MKKTTSTFDRLMQAARQACPQDPPPVLSRQLATRILACWRHSSDSDSWSFLSMILRRALYGAALIMVICLVWSYSDISLPDADVALANYEVQNEVQFDPLL